MKRFLCIFFTITLCLLSACGNQADSMKTEKMDSVIIVLDTGSEPEAGFDPAYGWGAGEHVHEPLIQSTLTVTNSDLSIGYDLATALSVSEDGMTYTIKIRTDAKFSDGEPLTAIDVAFTYNTLKETSTVTDFTMLDHAEAVGSDTVVFTLNQAYSIWPYTMASVGIVPEHAYNSDYGENPIGSGRYMLKQWDKGQQVLLEANPYYYGEQPSMRKVTILFMSEEAAFAAVQSGQADLAYTSASYAEQNVSGYSLLAAKSVDNRGVNLPAVASDGTVGNDFTSDENVRKAINLGIDRERMIDYVLNGYGSAAYSVCDGLPWAGGSTVEYDPQEAAALLDTAGWILKEDGIREKGGVKAQLNILYPTSDSVRQALAAELSNQLKELGIDATYEGVGWDTAYDRAFSQPLVWGWGSHTPMEVYNLYHTTDSGTALYSPYSNPGADALMDQALASGNLEESYSLWQQAQTLISADAPWVWLVNVDHLYWAHDGLEVAEQKIHPHGFGWSIVNNIDQWSWKSE